ncbi:tetratricopeptide repeat protein [Pedomonas mirosovicensis]|uniref:tetratricopeptide repeat protein n=1 Tax=Pedomonas mirosovicensis TaxID=2908641 RepID=UPI00216A2F1A|nr:tetratricopeptide repeat protein [Pedomonas mirosovicensis]MCH8683778.1 hypothetical protein [Pedomonas mirosovicensis]
MIALVLMLMVAVVLALVLRPLLVGPRAGYPGWAAVVLVILGLGGGTYAVVGHPAAKGIRPAAPAAAPEADEAFAEARSVLLENPADVPAWLRLSMALSGKGETERAAEALSVALGAMPDSPDLWIGYGETLTAHAGGQVTPAARLAFDRANQLAPHHPAPKYYLALSWLQSGNPREALAALEDLAKESKPDAPWMPRVERMMRGARTMIAAGVGPNGALPGSPATASPVLSR